MSKSLYTLRTISTKDEPKFDAFGVIEKFKTYEESQHESRDDVMTELLVGPRSASARAMLSMKGLTSGINLNIIDARSDKNQAAPEFMSVNISIDLDATDLEDIKPIREKLVEGINRWAEKSRVRGSRGWRVNAIKAPRIERNKGPNNNPAFNTYSMKCEVILSTVVFYNESIVKILANETDCVEDINNLHRHLKKISPIVCSTNVKHSHYGSFKF